MKTLVCYSGQVSICFVIFSSLVHIKAKKCISKNIKFTAACYYSHLICSPKFSIRELLLERGAGTFCGHKVLVFFFCWN